MSSFSPAKVSEAREREKDRRALDNGKGKEKKRDSHFFCLPIIHRELTIFNLTLFSFRFVNNIPTGKKNLRQLLKLGLILGYAVSITETAFLFL